MKAVYRPPSYGYVACATELEVLTFVYLYRLHTYVYECVLDA